MLRIYLTGELCLTSPGRIVHAGGLRGRQSRLAFAYLATERSRPVPRDQLVELLWPDRMPPAFEVALSALVSKLRSLLAEVGAGRGALVAAAGCYQLQLPAGSWIDTEAAARALHDAEAALRTGSHARAYGPAVVAFAILRRPFLPGDDGSWIEDRRRELLRMRLRSLDCLAEIHSWNREPQLALACAEEAVALEPFREEGYRRLMQIHHRAGNAAEALLVYDRLEHLLAAELSTRPAAETNALREELQRR